MKRKENEKERKERKGKKKKERKKVKESQKEVIKYSQNTRPAHNYFIFLERTTFNLNGRSKPWLY
jgi:hypothetical protein